jgi:predicted metal-dependent hydrolase
MHLLTPGQILARSADPAARAGMVALTPVDFDRPFIPERFTQLYYAECYPRLERRHRLRYNQLFAVKVSEQFMAFEQDFTNRVVARLARHPAVEPALRECLQGMVREEETHQAMFRALNAHCLPQAYAGRAREFTRLGRLESWALGLATAASRWLPFLMFFIVALEEYSSALSRAMMKERETALGPLEENFVRVHAEHVKDEARHVHLDVHLIRVLYAATRPLARRLNARLLAAFLRDILVPKRAGPAVVRRLVQEHPELEPARPGLLRELRALRHHQGFQRSLFNRELMPHTFALFDAQPELAILDRVLAGYARG